LKVGGIFKYNRPVIKGQSVQWLFVFGNEKFCSKTVIGEKEAK
jgi:hypothetical protein